jgi:xanthine dehydrogenase accessory factor
MTDTFDKTALDDIARVVRGWTTAGSAATLSRVVRRVGFGSVPYGEVLAITDDGRTVGRLLAGTVDDPVRRASAELLTERDPSGFRSVAAEIHGGQAIEAGLACGGQATVLVQDAERIPAPFWSALTEHRPVTLATVIGGALPALGRSRVYVDALTIGGTTGDVDLDEELDDLSRRLLDDGESTARVVDRADQSVLVEAFVPPPRLVILGGGDLAEAIIAQAALLGWDARTTGDPSSTSEALQWAGPSAALIVLSHDPDVDTLVMASAITREVRYIGALGSRRTQLNRAERLRALGVADDDLARIRGPIGLDLGGRQASHVALAVCAEILASRTGRDARPLAERMTTTATAPSPRDR